jgi:hypothetical protein
MIITCNSKVIEILFAIIIIANNIYTVYMIINNKECIEEKYLYNTGIISILNNMITFSLLSIFIIRHIQNTYYDLIFGIFTTLSFCGSSICMYMLINYNIITGDICNYHFYYVIIINIISSIIPVFLITLFFIGIVIFYIPYSIIKRNCIDKKYVSKYAQTTSETFSLISDNPTFIYPSEDFNDIESFDV